MAAPGASTGHQPAQDKKRLTILCLHGFRQNSSQFKGRLRALQKKLSSIATLVFIDAPYVLPLWYKASTDADSTASTAAAPQQTAQQQQQALDQQLQPHGPAAVSEPRSSSLPTQTNPPSTASPGFSAGVPKTKRAWLLSEDLLSAQPELQELFARAAPQDSNAGDATACGASSGGQQQQQQSVIWTPAPAHITTEAQYTTQALGWDASWQVIQVALTAAHTPCQQMQQQSQQQQVMEGTRGHQDGQQHCSAPQQLLQQVSHIGSLHKQQQQQLQELQRLPPIDGILGFSQGAAVAAVVAALCQQQQRQQQVAAQWPSQLQSSPVHVLEDQANSQQQLPQLKFVLIASGFVSPAPEHRDLLQKQAPIALPSLHMFASGAEGGLDRQIQQQMSEQLLKLFDESSRCVVTHAGGHMVPSAAAAVAQIKGFLQQFI